MKRVADHWNVLGISPTAEESVVRRAYAQRLKITNPEDDADGFMRLRAAYEAAMHAIKYGYANYDFQESPDSDDDEAHDDTGADEPDAFDPPKTRNPDESEPAHWALVRALEQALRTDANPWAIMRAWESLIQSDEIQRIEIFGAFEEWLIELLQNTRPASDVLFEPAIAYFQWGKTAETYGSDARGALIVDLWRRICKEKEGTEFIAHVRDRRHKFHSAYEILSKPVPKNLFVRWWQGRKLGAIVRFLRHVAKETPYAETALDQETVHAWLARRARGGFGSMLIIVGAVLTIGGFGLFISTPLDERPAAVAMHLSPAEREDCKGSLDAPLPDVTICQRALAKAPNSLMLHQYYGIAALKRQNPRLALGEFTWILERAPTDPFALYGKGLVEQSLDGVDGDSGGPPVRAWDAQAEAYFAQFGLKRPAGENSASEPAQFPFTPSPKYDVAPAQIGQMERAVFDDAYTYFGIGRPFEDGTVLLECLVAASGTLHNCRVAEEMPRNEGRAELAMRVAESIKMSPAMSGDIAVQDYPVRVPFRFRAE